MSYFRLAVQSALFSRITAVASPFPVRCIFTLHIKQIRPLMEGKTMHHISLSSGHAPLLNSAWNVVSVLRKLATKTVKSSINAKVPGLAATASRDVTVYTYENSRYFMFLTIFGAFFFLFFANIGHLFITVPLSQLHQKKSDAPSDSIIMQILMWLSQDHIKVRIGIACLSLGTLALAFTLLLPLRTVSQLTLLKGGDKLSITTYAMFGQRRQFTVNLDDVSCSRSRQSAPNKPVSMKVRGSLFYFVLDTADGQFCEPKLFDHVVGLQRSFK